MRGQQASTQANVHICNGFNLVIRGDGTWSRVRNLLNAEKSILHGGSLVSLYCLDARANTWLLDYVGAGSGCVIQSQRGDNRSIVSYVSLRVHEDFLNSCGIGWSDVASAR
jgi:hypothetical protein